MVKVTQAQLRDPHFRSYEKCLVIGEKPIECECGTCGGAALIMPALNMQTPSTGTLICPSCWHPVIGRILLTIANQWGRSYIRAKKWQPFVQQLLVLGLLRDDGEHYYALTPPAMSVLWVKEKAGWEFEKAHARGWYRSVRIGGDWASGYWSNGETGHWIHHRWGTSRKPWPISGHGVLRFGDAA